MSSKSLIYYVAASGEIINIISASILEMDETKDINSIAGVEVLRDEPLDKYCLSGTGGNAKYLFIAENVEALIVAVISAQKMGMPYRVIGIGGGLLFSDNGFQGLVIINKSSRIFSIPGTNIISCDSGVRISQLINYATERGLGGLESFYNLRGSIGGAIYNNAYVKQSICGLLRSVTLLTNKGKIVKRDSSWLNCADRSTKLMNFPKDRPWTLLVCDFRFQQRKSEDIQRGILLGNENVTQKDNRIIEDIFLDNDEDKAENIISRAGTNKLKMGNAEVIPQRSNCIKITKGASSEDIRKLIEQIRETVFKESGIQLIESIEYFGLWH